MSSLFGRFAIVSAIIVPTLTPLNTLAMPGQLPDGATVLGKGGNTGFFQPGLASNPALLPSMLKGRNWAIGGFSLPAFAIELGDVDNLSDNLDGLEEALDDAESDFSPGGEDVTPEEAAAIKSEYGDFVADLDNGAYIGLDANLPVPVMPIMFNAFGGTVAINAEASLGVNIAALGDDLVYNEAEQELETDTSVYVRSGEFARIGVAFGRTFMPISLAGKTFDVSGGGRLTVTQASLSHQVIALMDEDDEDGDSAVDRAEDNYDLNKQDTTAFGLDVGVALISETTSVGVTLRNLLPQEFDFKSIGSDCGTKLSDAERRDCFAAANFKGRINLKDTYKLEPQLMLEATHLVHASGLRVFGSLEANAVENVAGNEYQWATAGVGFSGPWWLPSVQLAYQSNLGGQKLDMFSLGLQLFRAINVQVSASPDKVEVDGDAINRAAAISISFGTSL